jgi:hypothetical protein
MGIGTASQGSTKGARDEDRQMMLIVQTAVLAILAAIVFGGVVILVYRALGWLLD